MALFPAVLALWNAWVHISILNSSDKLTYIEVTVNDVLSQRTILGIPDVHPNHCHIRFRGHFNDTSVIRRECGQTLARVRVSRT